jgi:glutathione S-transferase
MIKIIGKAASINVRKVLWTCAEIGIEFDNVLPDAQLATFNPNALVPVLVDGDAALWESNTICRYLAGHHGREDLLPAAPLARARVEQWMDWQAGELNNAWRYAFMALVRKSPAHGDLGAVAASVANWNRHMAILDAQLAATGAFVAGAHFTLADVVLGLSVHRWAAAPIDHASLPNVLAYYDRLSGRPAFMAHGRNGLP